MMLCLDSGNTRLKWALRDGDQWRATGAVAHDEIDAFVPPDPLPERIVGCNVAGATSARRIEATLGRPVTWIASTAAQCGVTNGYEQPATLGADRWSALVGARALHAGTCLVVLSGTATTIDVLDAGGMHRGGIILPGLSLMASALSQGTAALPEIDIGVEVDMGADLPRNTRDAMASGVLIATTGAIHHMFKHLVDATRPLCILSGGAAEVLLPLLEIPVRRVDHLVLEGLAVIADARS